MLSYQVESPGKPLAKVLRETPQPRGTEVVVRVGCCGVSRSTFARGLPGDST